jgi:hypothetical protein
MVSEDAELAVEERLDRGDDLAHEAQGGMVLHEIRERFLWHLVGARRLGLGIRACFTHRLVPEAVQHVQALEDVVVLLASEHSLKAVVDADFVEHQTFHVAGLQVLQDCVGAVGLGVVEAVDRVACAKVGDDVVGQRGLIRNRYYDAGIGEAVGY